MNETLLALKRNRMMFLLFGLSLCVVVLVPREEERSFATSLPQRIELVLPLDRCPEGAALQVSDNLNQALRFPFPEGKRFGAYQRIDLDVLDLSSLDQSGPLRASVEGCAAIDPVWFAPLKMEIAHATP